MARLHARLLWCQVDADDLPEFRDRVLVPALADALKKPDIDRSIARGSGQLGGHDSRTGATAHRTGSDSGWRPPAPYPPTWSPGRR